MTIQIYNDQSFYNKNHNFMSFNFDYTVNANGNIYYINNKNTCKIIIK